MLLTKSKAPRAVSLKLCELDSDAEAAFLWHAVMLSAASNADIASRENFLLIKKSPLGSLTQPSEQSKRLTMSRVVCSSLGTGRRRHYPL
jgi:hypothetical protein